MDDKIEILIPKEIGRVIVLKINISVIIFNDIYMLIPK